MPYAFTINHNAITPEGERFLASLGDIWTAGTVAGERTYTIPDEMLWCQRLGVWRGRASHTDLVDDYLQVSDTTVLVVEHWISDTDQGGNPTFRIHEGTKEQIDEFMGALPTPYEDEGKARAQGPNAYFYLVDFVTEGARADIQRDAPGSLVLEEHTPAGTVAVVIPAIVVQKCEHHGPDHDQETEFLWVNNGTILSVRKTPQARWVERWAPDQEHGMTTIESGTDEDPFLP